MKAYQFIEEKEIKELETMARVYEHKKTGAKVLCLENKDEMCIRDRVAAQVILEDFLRNREGKNTEIP